MPKTLPPSKPTIISLFDATGNWSRFYSEAGYHVILVDLAHGKDIFTWEPPNGLKVRGILAAPPCTDFAASGAQYWKAKDADGRTAESLRLLNRMLDLIWQLNPDWWAFENPVGRINKLIPWLRYYGPWYFQPFWYGDPYTKKTGLWGNFNRNLPRVEVAPIKACSQGSWVQQLGGKSERTKYLRSVTPLGFARAFFAANP